jgi:hypothetical protein
MDETSRSLDDLLANSQGLSESEMAKLRDERIHAVTAILLHQQGNMDASQLLTEVAAFSLDYQETDWNIEYYDAILDVEPHVTERFSEEIQNRILETLNEVAEREVFNISKLRVRALLPKATVDWKRELKSAQGPQSTNQARKARLEPRNPAEDGLIFTNEWEHRVYTILKERQAELPDNDTIGIMPLGAIKVRDHVFEPDFLISYRGFAGIIEIDGPHHKKRISDDKSRERLLRNCGIKYIDRLDVQDTTKRPEVEKFVTDFLRHLIG